MVVDIEEYQRNFVKQTEIIAAYTLGLDLTECDDEQKRQEIILHAPEIRDQITKLADLHKSWCEYKSQLSYGPMTEEYIEKLTEINNAKAKYCTDMKAIRIKWQR